MHVLSGAVKISALNMDDFEDITSFVLTGRTPKIFEVPDGFYNGALSLTDRTKIIVYSTLAFDEVKNDDFRLPYDFIKNHWKVISR